MISLTDYSRLPNNKGWGSGWPTDRSADMVRVTAPISGVAVRVHKRLAILVGHLLAETEHRGYLLHQEQTGAFNSRPIAGTNTPSNHSWGIAIDLNWQHNPVSFDGRAHTDFPPWLVPLWNDYGFAWGGAYVGSYKDAMHLEFMGSPADADDMTALAGDRLREVEDVALSDADIDKLVNAVWLKVATGITDAAHPKVNLAQLRDDVTAIKAKLEHLPTVAGTVNLDAISAAVCAEAARRLQA